ncbi:SDR family NAD(P)-dependent oxidoreductase [Pelagibacterium limicola]|uniref:SDR family NAD(P)-dependent oxidoreductase n=1 Tax=Pelagibacterium limicola TaxID=2791022 RepID=UPI0031B5C6AF
MCALDITDPVAAHSVAAQTFERFGAIDVLVNKAGYAELGFFETFTDAAVRRQDPLRYGARTPVRCNRA